MIHIIYFGHLHDTLGCHSEQLTWAGGTTEDLLALLRERGEPWLTALHPDKLFKIAINRKLAHETARIEDGAEVGILPPVTGG